MWRQDNVVTTKWGTDFSDHVNKVTKDITFKSVEDVTNKKIRTRIIHKQAIPSEYFEYH
jgi:hypothetical protein